MTGCRRGATRCRGRPPAAWRPGGRCLVLEARAPRRIERSRPRASARQPARFRASHGRPRAAPQNPSRAEHDLAPPEILPIDSTKTFVGINSNYYDENWRLMEWRDVSRSWNWAAALTMGGWLAYRRLYDHAVLHAVWLTLLILLALSGTPLSARAARPADRRRALGVYGNALYRRRFRRAAGGRRAPRRRVSGTARPCWLRPAAPIARAVWLMAAAMAARDRLPGRLSPVAGRRPA